MGKQDVNTTSAGSAIAKNPYLKNVGRGPYELVNLLLQIPEHYSIGDQPQEVLQKIEAAQTHAENSINTIASGLESLGNVLAVAVLNENSGINLDHVANVGWLVAHLSVELQALSDLRSDIDHVLKGAQ